MGSKLREKDLLAEIDRLRKIVEELKTSKPYGLVWEDKPEQFETVAENAVPVLKNRGGKFKDVELDPSSDHNVLIEGDNYHALSVLSYTHRGKIDVIYIDPPYNTGNDDFIYNDNFVKKEDDFRHSKWLSFMEKRLKLSRQLLKDNGAVFISIDENEQAPLRMLCDEIFGENNFVATLIWKSKSGGANDSRFFAVDHEYIMVFANNAETFKLKIDSEADVSTSYNLRDEKGWYSLDRLDKQSIRYSPSLDYKIVGPDGKEYYPKHRDPKNPNASWRWGKATVKERYDELVFKNGSVYTKNYEKEGVIPRSLLIDERFGRTRTGKTELYEMFGKEVFSNPKPSKLITYLVNLIPSKNCIFLDFFAGSGTTGHAVLQLNEKDGGNRRFILCTNNENNICEDVTYERMKRVMKGYTTPAGEKVEGLGGNLKYLKTDFVKKELPVGLSDEAKMKLTHRANLLLSLKENTFTPVEATDYYEITASPNKITAVYFREDKAELTTMLDKLLDLSGNKPVAVYIFAWEKGAYKAGMPGYPFDFQDIPEPIVEVYQSIGY